MLPPEFSHGGSTSRLILCTTEHKSFVLSRNTPFNELNRLCLEVGIIDNRLFDSLERIRTQRNEIHLQGRDSFSRSYTLAMLEESAGIVAQLSTILNGVAS